MPCSSCTSRDAASACHYGTGSEVTSSPAKGGSRTSEAQLRLQKLEETVTTLLRGDNVIENIGIVSPPTDATDGLPRSRESTQIPIENRAALGHLDIKGSQTTYVGATHWASILNNVREVFQT